MTILQTFTPGLMESNSNHFQSGQVQNMQCLWNYSLNMLITSGIREMMRTSRKNHPKAQSFLRRDPEVFPYCRRLCSEFVAPKSQSRPRKSSGPIFSGTTVGLFFHYCNSENVDLETIELATGCESARTPWATIGEDPANFFDPSCLPEGFRFQDPSRMGVNVKSLLICLRERQELYGVGAFKFHHVLCNNQLEPAKYPEAAISAMNPKPKEDESQEVVSPPKKGKGKQSRSSGPINSNVYDPVLMAGDPPARSGQTQPALPTPTTLPAFQHGWPPITISSHQSGAGPLIPPPLNPNVMSNLQYPQMYNHMPYWGIGPPGWPPGTVTTGQTTFQIPGPIPGLPDTGATTSNHAHLGPTPLPFEGPNDGVHDPAATSVLCSSIISNNPIPPGEPPFAHLQCRPPADPSPPAVAPAIGIPSKKGSGRTPKNTPSKNPARTPVKRMREDEEDSPTKRPTRVSTRTRTPKKHFEID